MILTLILGLVFLVFFTAGLRSLTRGMNSATSSLQRVKAWLDKKIEEQKRDRLAK